MNQSIINIAASIIIGLCAISVIAQDTHRPDRWAGMVLNISTPDDAFRLFGTPAKDKDRIALDLPRTLSWLSDKSKDKLFRTLTYKRIQEYNQVRFSFLDGKLVAITMQAPDAELKDKWIDPDELEALFAVAFKPHHRGSELPEPSDFQVSAKAELEKNEYAYWYDMIAVSDSGFIIAIVDNYQYTSGIFDSPDVKRRKKINARGLRYPGYVSEIEILSRVLASS